jgi:hypothetical protein
VPGTVPLVAQLSERQVESLAQDPSSLQGGRSLATPAPWSALGHNDLGAWGACRGSGRAPYQVVVSAGGTAFRCTCPSRKSPCKHALGLLLLWARQPARVSDPTPPGDAAAWLATTQGRRGPAPTGDDTTDSTHSTSDAADTGSGGDETSAAAPSGPTGRRPPVADPEAAAARAARRTARIVAAMAELDRWLHDLLRGGLGQAQALPPRFWDEMAARLVDGQAPAAATQVRRLATVVGHGDSWPGLVLGHMARLHLLASGWSRLEQLSQAQRDDLRTAAGWPWPSEQVLTSQPESDRWYVLGRSETEEERVSRHRLGPTSARLLRPEVGPCQPTPGSSGGRYRWPR